MSDAGIARALKAGDMLKVQLPGESLWAKVVDVGPPVVAELRNQSIHGIAWGTRVTLDEGAYKIVEPADAVAQAQAGVDAFQAKHKARAVAWRERMDKIVKDIDDFVADLREYADPVDADLDAAEGVRRALRELLDEYESDDDNE